MPQTSKPRLRLLKKPKCKQRKTNSVYAKLLLSSYVYRFSFSPLFLLLLVTLLWCSTYICVFMFSFFIFYIWTFDKLTNMIDLLSLSLFLFD